MIQTRVFGKTSDGRDVLAFTIKDGQNEVTILNLGGIIQSLRIANKNGELIDVVLGYNDVASYEQNGGYLGALIAGIIGGIFSSPCSTPVLVALIAMIAATESTAQGAFLMLLYSIGCTALAVVLGSFPSIIRKIGRNGTFRLVSRILNILLGAGVFLIGLVLLYLGL